MALTRSTPGCATGTAWSPYFGSLRSRSSTPPYANGGVLLRDLKLPKYGDHAVPVAQPGVERVSAMITLGSWLRDVISQNPETFRLFGPDETASNRLQDVYEVTD